jgi:hypothetical protein
MKTLQKLDQPERLIPGLLFLFISSIYFMTVTGITSSNDGSHYAAARAFAESGRLDIAPYASFTQEQDYSIDQYGALRTDRPQGTAIVASVVYRVGQLAPEPFAQVPSKHDPVNPNVIYAVLAAVLAGTTTLVLFYSILRQHFLVSTAPALLATLALAFGTTIWKYSTVLYSHTLASMSIFIVLYFVLRAERRGMFTNADAAVTGFFLGASILFEYTNAVMVVAVLLYVTTVWGPTFLKALRDPTKRRPWSAAIGAAVAGGIAPIAFFLVYNTTVFGGPFEFSTFETHTDPWASHTGFASDFATPIFYGLRGMLLWGGGSQGLFLLAPISILSFFGLRALYRHKSRHFWLLIGLFVAALLLFSKSTTFNPRTNDARYITPFVGLWFIPLALWLDRTYFGIERELPRVLVSLLLFGLLFLSVRNVAAHIALSWGYDLDLTDLEYRSIPPYNLRVIGSTLFPNAPNLPLLWLLEAVAFVLGLGFVWARRALASRLRPVLDAAALIALVGFALAPVGGALRDPQPPGMTALDEPLGDNLRLLGYQLSEWHTDAQPGDPVRVRLYWQLESPADEEMDVHLTLVDQEGKTWGETKTPLGLATFRQIPVTAWPAGRVIQEEYTIPLNSSPPYSLETDLVLTVADETVTLLALRPATLTLSGPPAYSVTYDFEGLARLTGYDVESLPYGRVAVTLHWEVTDATDIAYLVFIHVVSGDATIAVQRDAQPFESRFPTTQWQPGDILADRHVIDLGRGFRPETYRLRVGLYNPEDDTRVPVIDASDQPVYDYAPVLGEVALP